jgi:NRPS condensation-like uncharacterized protein
MARAQKRQEVQQLNVRVPRDVYEALRTYAYATDSTINDAAIQALVDFLSTKGRQKQVDTFLEHAREDWRAALDKLANL